MNIRKIVFWSHLVVGVAAGLIVLVLAVTGVILTYEVQIIRWADHRVAIEGEGARLDAGTLAEAALSETGGQATALVIENDPTAPVTATFGRGNEVLLDPNTGAALGGGNTAVHRIFRVATSLHRWLAPNGFNGAGKALTGAANLGFFFLALSGAYLWLPKVWRWAMFKTRMVFRRYPNAQARDFHWHHIFGFWALIPLIVIIFTGVTMSYDRVQGVVMTLSGVGADEGGPRRPGTGNGSGTGTLQLLDGGAELEAILATAMAHDPAWRRVTLELPLIPGVETVTAKVDTGPGRRETRKETLSISQVDARGVAVETFADQPKALRTLLFLRFAHTGEHYGLVGQTIAGLASLATVFMVYTGLTLAWRRLVSPVLRRRRRAGGG